MSVSPEQNQAQTQEQKPNDKELNFRRQEEYFKRQLEQEKQARLAAEQKAAQLEKSTRMDRGDEEDEPSDEPYIDEKRFNKKLAKFEKNLDAKIEQKAEQKARMLVEEERRSNYLAGNKDFNEIMSPENVEKFAERFPTLAEGILKMPEGFERQKLVYENIKALGVNKKEAEKSAVQEKVNANLRSPYYQPSGIGTAPYGQTGAGGKVYSDTEMKSAYDQMQQLKRKLRI